MLFDYKYKGSSSINNYNPDKTDMGFVPDATREPTFFSGELVTSIEFREAISALHDVVISDLRFKPKDKTEYKEWAEKQENIELIKLVSKKQEIIEKVNLLEKEYKTFYDKSYLRMKPFYNARQKYFNYLYEKDKVKWFVLDPVITIHPDEIFFECFSQDESSYGKLGVKYEGFKNIKEFACGTTNIDYSENLYNEFQKIRSYKQTFFNVDPSGFDISTTNQDNYKEVKIDLPDSWVRGFLQVSSAMSMPMISFDLHPMDIYNICTILKRHKEKLGPRSLKYILKPNQPVKIIFEPWNIELECSRSFYYGDNQNEIRVWGRRRLLILERLIQLSKKFKVYLLGNGMPSFYIADLGHMSFTLGLSGWTKNDWSSSGNFDLMAPRGDVDDLTKQRVFNKLKETWYENPDKLAYKLGLDRSVVLSALSSYTQAGRTIYDLDKNVYRIRELSREPLPMEKLRFSSPREEKANNLINSNLVTLTTINEINDSVILSGTIKEGYNSILMTSLSIDKDLKISNANCTCNFYNQNKLYKGPCEHMLSLRIIYENKKANI